MQRCSVLLSAGEYVPSPCVGLCLGSQEMVMLEVPDFKADFSEGGRCITAVMQKG